MDALLGSFGFLLIGALFVIVKSVRIVNEYERGVSFAWGASRPRTSRVLGSGCFCRSSIAW